MNCIGLTNLFSSQDSYEKNAYSISVSSLILKNQQFFILPDPIINLSSQL